MAVSFSLYDHTVKKMINKEVTYTTLKVMLLNNTANFIPSDATLDAVAGAASPHRVNEVYGNGWTEGGITITGAAVTTTTTNDAKFDGNDVSVTATGGSIGPAYKAVVYDDTDASKAPLAFIDFGQAETAGESNDYRIIWNASGIITWTY